MKNHLTLLLLFAFFSLSIGAQEGVIHLANPSFEGRPVIGDTGSELPKGCTNCGFPNETPPDVHPTHNNPFGVTTMPLHGGSYLGLVVRENNTWERVSEELSAPLQAGVAYVFKIHLAKSAFYMSPTQTSNGRMFNYTTPCQLRIWSGNQSCQRKELLAETGPVTNTRWMECTILLQPTKNHQYLTFEAYYTDEHRTAYNGNLLLDFASDIVPVDSFDITEIEKLMSGPPKKRIYHVLPDFIPEDISADSLSVDELQQLLRGELIEPASDDADEVAEENPTVTPEYKRFEFMEVLMGAEFKIVLYAKSDSLAEQAAQKAFERMRDLESIFSYDKKDSEINRLQEIAGTNKRRKVSDELWEVLMLAQEATDLSKGAYNNTSGALINLWEEAFQHNEIPSEEAIKQALATSGQDNIVYEADQQIHISQPGLLFHINDIAKGYLSDQAIKILKAHNIAAAIIDNGKSKVVFGSPNANDSWQLERPAYRSKGQITAAVSLSDQAIATFGHPYTYLENGSLRYSNIINCQTGYGFTKKEIVSVVAPTCVQANAWTLVLSCTADKKKFRAKVEKEGGRSFVSEF